MSVAICSMSSGAVSFPLEKEQQVLGSIVMPSTTQEPVMVKNVDESPPPPPAAGELIDIWSSIQARKAEQPNFVVDKPYVHPLSRPPSSGLMSQKSLEICTESLGSETGSDDDTDHLMFSSTSRPIKQQQAQQQQEVKVEEEEDVHDHDHEHDDGGKKRRKEEEAAAGVNYHCSIGSGRSPSRAFPPPLPSISCRDGPCVQMRPRRKDGRLVVEAVEVPSQNYLHSQRQGGRLLLSFINTTATPNRNIIDTTTTNLTPEQEQQEQVVDDGVSMELEEDQEEEEAEEEEEEEVEVVDRGTVVEVKVSTQQPQQQSGGGGRSAAMKVHRSSIVINKFVSCTSLSSQLEEDVGKENIIITNSTTSTASGTRRSTACSTTTAAAAAVAASSLGAVPGDGGRPCFDNKLLLTTSRRRNREELLREMRRCSQLRKPLFIWEPRCCIATSS